jgi:hypothetical protein
MDALHTAAEEILAGLVEQLPDADTATMARAIGAAEEHLADVGRRDHFTIAAAVRLGVAAAGCP